MYLHVLSVAALDSVGVQCFAQGHSQPRSSQLELGPEPLTVELRDNHSTKSASADVCRFLYPYNQIQNAMPSLTLHIHS